MPFERLVQAGAELGLGLNLRGRTQASQLSERSNLTPEDFINSEEYLGSIGDCSYCCKTSKCLTSDAAATT